MEGLTIQRSRQDEPPPLGFRIWQAFGHPATLILLLILFLAALIADVWLPQAPSLLAGDALARNEWLAATAARHPAGALVQTLGLFDLAHNALLRILLSLLAVVLAVRLFERLHLAWSTRRLSPPLQALPLTTSYDFAIKTTVEPEQWRNVCKGWCQRQRRKEDTGATQQWRGDRHQAFTWMAPLIEVGLALILLSLALNLRFGWQLGELSLDPGGSISLEPYSTQKLSFAEDAETLSLCCQPERQTTVAAGAMKFGNLWLRQIQMGPALKMAVLAGEQSLLLQPIEQGGSPKQELVLRFPQKRSERAVAIPDRNLFLRIVHIGPDQYNIEALDASSTVLLSQKIEGAATLALKDMALHFTPTRHLKLDVVSRPWLWLLIPGILLISTGLFIRWRFPYLRVGTFATATGVAVRWQGQRGVHPTPEELGGQLAGLSS